MKNMLIAGIIIAVIVIGCGKTESPKTSTTLIPEKIDTTIKTESSVKLHTIPDSEIGQKVKCPVMGTDITVTKDTLSVEYKGKIYYFCCGGCPEKFKENPDKYISAK